MKKLFLFIMIFIITSAVTFSQQKAIFWSEDFEGNTSVTWSASSGVWEMGVPNSGPMAPHGGTKCAATILSGNYPTVADTRLFRLAYFTVPSSGEYPRLRFWHWYSFSSADYGKVQIHVQGTPGTEWIDISGQYINTGSSVWSYPSIDLSAYAGKTIQVGFFFHSEDPFPYNNVSTGWYIDDISLVTGPLAFNNPESWETGIGDWYAEFGTWEVGSPASGPASPHAGSNCAATVLKGSYATVVDSKLISPLYTVPNADQNPRLRFWHWYSFSSADYGKVQIHIQGTPGTEWIDISGQYINTGSSVWSYPLLDLSAYSGKTIQVGFFFHSEDPFPYNNVSTGWYIDDITVVTGPSTYNNPESWEAGIGDWDTEFGTWEIGSPTSGPPSPHGGSNCAATVLKGNYATVVDSKLISPPVLIPGTMQNPFLRFWHWYSFSTADYGRVMIKIEGSTQWEDISEEFINTGGGVWSYPALDLSIYAGKTVRIAFYFHAEDPFPYNNVSTGWYIDDIELQYTTVGIEESSLNKEGSLKIYPNPARDKFYIEFPNPNHKKYDLVFYSQSGKILFGKQNIVSEKIEIDKGILRPGIYFIRLKGDRIFTGEILIE